MRHSGLREDTSARLRILSGEDMPVVQCNLVQKLMAQRFVYNVRHPLKDLSSEEFVFGIEPVIEISLSD